MKKSLIALAVLAASGAAMAQSSVTLYGVADIWLGQVDDGAITKTKLDSGGVSTSRWGMKGSEDLGGGLKANFRLEKGFNIDDGKEKASGFDRQAWVGLSGGFGEVRLGNVTTAYDDVNGSAKGAFGSKLSAREGLWQADGYNGNPGNNIYYATPEMGGFSAAVSYALGENKAVDVGAGNTTSLALSYAAGPAAASLGYQTEKADGNADALKLVELNGSYDFGIATLLLGYGKVTKNNTGDSTDYAIGANFPVSAALTLSAEYARSKTDAFGPDAETKRSGYGIAAAYSLSKRTTVYGGYRAQTEKVTGLADVDTSLLAVGIKHTF